MIRTTLTTITNNDKNYHNDKNNSYNNYNKEERDPYGSYNKEADFPMMIMITKEMIPKTITMMKTYLLIIQTLNQNKMMILI